MESNKDTLEFTVVSGKELMQRCIIEINGLSGSNFELAAFENREVPLCTIKATKWKPQYIFLLGTIFQRFSSSPPEQWRIPYNEILG
ncbi:MAG TPA: hypothetical protein PLL53_18935 [Saprospiraceae bacterium]|nr:hypothetical protein [Saprospiraceae bacterium]